MVKIITLLLILLIIVLALISKLKDLGFSKKVPMYSNFSNSFPFLFYASDGDILTR